MSATVLGLGALGKYQFKTERVFVPEWDGDVILRQLSVEEMTQAQSLAMNAMKVKKGDVQVQDFKALASFRVTLVALAWVTQEGEQVVKTTDANLLLKEPYTVIDRLFDAVSEMNGVGQETEAVDDAEKN